MAFDLDIQEPAKVLGSLETIKQEFANAKWVTGMVGEISNMDLKVGGLNEPVKNVEKLAQMIANASTIVDTTIEDFSGRVNQFKVANEDITF